MLDMAERVGRDLARRGVKLVCGGGGGVMEAACRGAKSAAGLTIGILSSGDRSSANPWVDIPVPTGFSQGRNVLVVKTGDAVIAIGGRYGTLSEIGHALKAGIASSERLEDIMTHLMLASLVTSNDEIPGRFKIETMPREILGY